MSFGLWVRYLCGNGESIRRVAESRSAIWVGIGLVLLTAIARSYDQTFIAEYPLRWLFGPLAFSVVSGTWLYVVTYGWFARWRMKGDGDGRPSFWSGWRSFMGVFWMTAPVAWLYAIPVERFLEPVTAARANVGLLAIVSLWRVLLMTRVLQHLTRCPFHMGLFWVLFAAAVEVLVVFFFGGALAQAIMRGMGGMRNSPAEEVVMDAMGTTFSVALFTAPAALLLSFLRIRRVLTPLPAIKPDRMPWLSLGVAAVFWVAVAVGPQVEVARNVAVERLVAEGQYRRALEYLAAHRPSDFAPGRELPPKPYEYAVFDQLPACFDVVQPSDPDWVREFLVGRLNEIMVHFGPRGGRREPTESEEQAIEHIRNGIAWHGPHGKGLLQLVDGLNRIPEGREWLTDNSNFIEGVRRAAQDGAGRETDPVELQDWLKLLDRMKAPLPTESAP